MRYYCSGMLFCWEEARRRHAGDHDIPDDLRARIMSESARRGYRGYGKLVVEALRAHLDATAARAGVPILTRNVARFSRMSGVDVLTPTDVTG